MKYNQVKAIQLKWEKKLKELFPEINHLPGIYVYYRQDGEYTKWYVGQAKDIIERTVSHLMGYSQHIDLSLKKRGFFVDGKPDGWSFYFYNCALENLDEEEKATVRKMSEKPFSVSYNVTLGGQGEGKEDLNSTNRKSGKSYYDGVAYGEQKAKKYVKEMFDKYLDYSIKDKPNKIKERKLEEFENYLKDFVQSP